MKRIAPVLLASLALVAAGCGGDEEQPGATSSDSAPAASSGDGTSIAMKNIAFSPKETTVEVGQKVTWTNEEDIEHNVVATEGAEFESEIFGKDGTYSYTPEEAGKIEYTCTLHPGMDGELTVTG
jgi:plastocyanin